MFLSKINLFMVLFMSVSGASYDDTNQIRFHQINDLILFEARVNHGQSGNFILDTGSEDFFVNTKYFDDPSQKTAFQTINGSMNVEEIQDITLHIGTKDILISEAFELEMDAIESFLNQPILGILGLHSIKTRQLIIDYQENILLFNDYKDLYQSSADYSAPLQFWNGLPVLTLEIEGKDYRFLLDSGASNHIIDSQALDQSNISYDLLSTVQTIDHIGNKAQLQRIHASNMGALIGNDAILLIKDLRHFFKDDRPEYKIHGILSPSQFDFEFVFIDYKKNRCYLKKKQSLAFR